MAKKTPHGHAGVFRQLCTKIITAVMGGVTMCDAYAIAHALGGKKYGDSYRMCCPAHGGRNPTSLCVTDDGDRTLVHCFAGCSQDEVIQALTDLGLWESSSRFENYHRRDEIDHARLVVRIAESDIQRGKHLSDNDLEYVDRALSILREAQT